MKIKADHDGHANAPSPLLRPHEGAGSAGKVPAGTDVTVVDAIVGAFDGGTLWN